MVGREEELGLLRHALELAAAHGTHTVAILGEGGIGKSRLLREFVVQARGAGATTLVGAGLPLTAPPPYGPWIDAFRQHRRRTAGDATPEEMEAVSEMLSRLDGSRGGEGPPDAESRRGRLLGTFWEAIDRICQGGPLVVVVDDAQWLDQGSIDLVGYLHAQHQFGALTVLAVRSDEAIPLELQRLLGELQRSDRHDRIELEPLVPASVAQQIAAIRSDLDSASVSRIVARAEGNPLFAELLAAEPMQGDAVGTGAREVARDRIRRLSAGSQRVVSRLAAVGARSDFDLLIRLTDQPRDDLLAALREATLLGVIRPTFEGEREAYDLRHSIFREAAYEELMPGERSELHRSIADALAHQSDPASGAAGATWSLLAHHRDRSHDAPRALAAHIEAATAATGQAAYGDALRHYGRAVELWSLVAEPDRPAESSLVELLEAAAESASAAGEPREAVTAQQKAIARAGADGLDEDVLARMHLRLSGYAWEAGDDETAAASHESAMELSGAADPRSRAMVLAADASQLMVRARFDPALKRANQALRAARQAGARDAEGGALAVMGVAKVNLGKVEQGIEDLRRARAIADETRDPASLRRTYVNLVGALVRAGRRDEAIAVGEAGLKLAAELGLEQSFGALLAANVAVALFEAGRWDEALEVGNRILRRDRQTLAAVYLSLVIASIWVHRGMLDAARSSLALADESSRATRDPTLTASVLGVAGELALADGRLADARAVVDQGLEALAGSDERMATATLLTVGLRASVAQRRKRVRQKGADASERVPTPYASLVGALAAGASGDKELLAEIATTRAWAAMLDGDEALDRWRESVERWRDVDQPYRHASAQLELARELLARRAAHAEPASLLQEAAATARRLGARPMLEQIELLARRSRISLEERLPGAAADADEDDQAADLGLSSRETEVLELVARGLTNRQIADTLFISEKTASVHVSNILGKLGVRSRVEAAGVAFESGIVIKARPSEQHADDGGTPAAAGGQRQTVTLMLTDIASSTALIEAIGDAAWTPLLRWHETTLRSLFADYAGSEIDHAGDGFFVAFPSSPAAIRCAIAIQRALDHHRRASGFAPEVRIGIHRTEVERDGEAYRGRGVHEAARIASAAEPSEILTSMDSLAGAPPRYRAQATSRSVTAAGLRTPIEVASISWR